MQRYAALEDICEKCADGQAVRKLQRVGAVSHTTASSEDCELKLFMQVNPDYILSR